MENIEREVRQLEEDVAEIKKVLVSPESCPGPRNQRFKVGPPPPAPPPAPPSSAADFLPQPAFQMVEQRVGSMRATVAQIQRCKPDLGLPGNAQETLTVFAVVNQLQILLQDLEQVRSPVPPVAPEAFGLFLGSCFFFFSRFCRKFRLCSPSSPWIRPSPGF